MINAEYQNDHFETRISSYVALMWLSWKRNNLFQYIQTKMGKWLFGRETFHPPRGFISLRVIDQICYTHLFDRMTSQHSQDQWVRHHLPRCRGGGEWETGEWWERKGLGSERYNILKLAKACLQYLVNVTKLAQLYTNNQLQVPSHCTVPPPKHTFTHDQYTTSNGLPKELDHLDMPSFMWSVKPSRFFFLSVSDDCNFTRFTGLVLILKSLRFTSIKKKHFIAHVCSNVQPGAVKSVLLRHWMHVTQVHPVTSENQFHYTRL